MVPSAAWRCIPTALLNLVRRSSIALSLSNAHADLNHIDDVDIGQLLTFVGAEDALELKAGKGSLGPDEERLAIQ